MLPKANEEGVYLTNEQICMRMFNGALEGTAKQWRYSQPPGSLTTWSEIADSFIDWISPDYGGWTSRFTIPPP